MKIPASLYWRTKAMLWFQPLYKRLGDLETLLLKSELAEISIEKPIYITALARSGTTILTEILTQAKEVCSHTYGDFPGVFTPYWNNALRQKKRFLTAQKIERTHGDRILINNDSPDAFEEVIWMYFFPQLHQANADNIDFVENKAFIHYYKNTIKKHLLVKNKSRYVAKANYNISRIESLLKIFPEAKFIIPIRHPVNHIASLIKQHNIFLTAAQDNPKINGQLAASGHFEFGDIRQIVNMPESDYADLVTKLWKNGKELQGWAHYWNGLYHGAMQLKNKSPALNQAIQFIRYEDLCMRPESTLDAIVSHCQLNPAPFEPIKHTYAQTLSPPSYYKIPFNSAEIAEIVEISQPVADFFGYNAENYQ